MAGFRNGASISFKSATDDSKRCSQATIRVSLLSTEGCSWLHTARATMYSLPTPGFGSFPKVYLERFGFLLTWSVWGFGRTSKASDRMDRIGHPLETEHFFSSAAEIQRESDATQLRG